MIEAIQEFFANHFPPEIAVIVTSMLPVIECRGAIPFGVALQLPVWEVYLLAVIGNLLPIPFILWLIRPMVSWFKNTRYMKNAALWLERKVEKNREKVLSYEFWGLCIFVAIPLPGTGAWTGALVAAMLEMRIKKAVPSIIIGVFISSTVMTILSYGVSQLIGNIA